ncbi:carotenoid oxygenase family protein [Microbulbifer sp. SA54]|uniref:carotenoid oxygenase family protein n=1 Tax=Microbulbifer sp. SA54 TaxID=3401577 RepID=UPI003AAEA6E7
MSSFLLISASALMGIALLLVGIYLAYPRQVLAMVRARANDSLDLDTHNGKSDYSLPGFLPVREELEHEQVKVEGCLPKDLEGVYLRNGTNYQFDQIQSRRHMFNGAGMLHQIQILDGKATYSNCYIRTPRFEAQQTLGRELYAEFGDIAGGGKAALFKVLAEAMEKRRGLIPAIPDLDNGSNTTAIQFHHDKLYCLQETCRPFVLDTRIENGRLVLPGTGYIEDFSGQLGAPFTAHPKIDPATGDWYWYSTDIRSGKVHFGQLTEGKLSRFSELLSAEPAIGFLHDYFLTERYSVFPDVSLRSDMKALTGSSGSPFFFDPDHKLRFGVIARDHQDGKPIRWFTTDLPGHIWHVINGWEETRADGGTDIVLFAPVFREYPATVPIHSSDEPHAYLHKFRFNLETGEVTEQRKLLDHFYERPTYNTAYTGRQNRYAYLLDEQQSGGIMGKGVLKYDLLEERELEYFDYGEYYGGEALFVARPDATGEDDGYIIDLLMAEDRAHLLVLDARNMTELARLHLPQRVPFGVHGCWLSNVQLGQLKHPA